VWIAYATEPLDFYHLRSFVAMESTTRSYTELVSMIADEETILSVCANLVMIEVPTDGSARKARFVHFPCKNSFLLIQRALISNRRLVSNLLLSHRQRIRRLQQCVSYFFFISAFTKKVVSTVTLNRLSMQSDIGC
jgi:hypothetical protein